MIEIRGWFLKCQRSNSIAGQIDCQNGTQTWLETSKETWLDCSVIKSLCYETDYSPKGNTQYIEIELHEEDRYYYRIYNADLDLLLLALKELNSRC